MKLIDGFKPESIIEKLSITKLDADISFLSKNQKKIIENLINCAKIIDDVYYLQKFADNKKLKDEIMKTNNPPLILCYKIMCGPYDNFNNDMPFIEGINKSDKVGFYPEDLTKVEWEKIINTVNKDEFISPYTIIRWDNETLKAIPYSEFYKEYLSEASKFLRIASEYAENHSLKCYLEAQAEAFLNNNYFNANVKWIQMHDNDIVPLIGPQECYDDKFLGYKTSFTAFVGIKNKEEFKKIQLIEKTIDLIQNRLPIPEHYRKQKRGSLSKIEIVDIIYNSGDSRSPIPAAAFNLPNSQTIRAEYGSKKVLLYNIMEAKFNTIMKNISQIVLDKSDQDKISFISYFNFILLHEISHELGIGFIKDQDGTMKDISYFLKDQYTIIEEAKADVMGIFSLKFLLKEGFITDCSYTNLCLIYLINLFRSIRFGRKNAHSISSYIQLIFMIEEGSFQVGSEDSIMSVNFHKIEKSIEKLLTIILTLQGEGDYKKAKEFCNKYSKTSEIVDKFVDRIKKLPIDILPWYPKAGEEKPI